MKQSNHVLKLSDVTAAYESALDEWAVSLHWLSESIQGAYDNDRILGDGQGLGFGDRIIPNPFNASESGWTAWNPLFSSLSADSRSPELAIYSLLSRFDPDFTPPDEKASNRVRWVTVQGNQPVPLRRIERIYGFKSIFYRNLYGRILSQSRRRIAGVFREKKGSHRSDPMRTRTQF